VGTFTLLPRVDRISSVVGTSNWIQLTASATVNTKGSYVELIASTPFYADAFYVGIRPSGTTVTFLVDLAVGASGSEQIILPDIFSRSSSATAATPFSMFYVPIHIKDGQRIAARCQSATASASCFIGLYLFGAT
jgi:hypothetical protein